MKSLVKSLSIGTTKNKDQFGEAFSRLSPVPPLAFSMKLINCLLIMESNSPEKLNEKWKDFDFSNVIALLMLIKEIQEQEPLEDPNIIMITKDGTPLY